MTDRPHIDSSKVQQLYAETHKGYSALFTKQRSGDNFCFNRRVDVVRELAPTRILGLLDCAVGSGEVTGSVLSNSTVEKVVVNDFSPHMMSLARSYLIPKSIEDSIPAILFNQDDIFHYLDSTDEEFDCILCIGLIAHTGRLDELLSSLRRRLSNNGVLLFQSTLANHPFVALHRCLTQKRYQRKFGYPIAYYTERELLDAFARNSFTITESRKFCIRIPFGDKISKRANYHCERILCNVAQTWGSECIYKLLAI